MLSRNTVKYIQSLTHKKYRDIHQAFIAETPKVVAEFLDSNFEVENIYATEKWYETQTGNKELRHLPITIVGAPDLEKISQLKTPHDVLAVFKIPQFSLPKSLSGKISVALDDLQDPGNLGTIIRIADWFGIENIICSKHTANAYNPKVVQASMGSLAHVSVFYLDLISFLKDSPLPVMASSLHGISLYKSPIPKEGILVIGNEAAGVSEEIIGFSTQQLMIPRLGKAESLNAAIATAVFLSHFTQCT